MKGERISDCCKAEVRLNKGESMTRYYICNKCDKPCNTHEDGEVYLTESHLMKGVFYDASRSADLYKYLDDNSIDFSCIDEKQGLDIFLNILDKLNIEYEQR